MRAMDYFRQSNSTLDPRMEPAIEKIVNKRRNNIWYLQAEYPGQTHFDMEQAGKPSRWNTLRALRVLSHFGIST